MIKVIVFDVGKVLVKEDMKKVGKIFCKKMKIDQKLFEDYVKKNLNKSLTGKLPAKKFFEDLCVKANRSRHEAKAMQNKWCRLFQKKRKIDKKILKLIKKLKKNYKVGALTNVTKLTHSVNNKMKVYNNFDFKVMSFKEGCTKSKKKIYKILLKKLGKNIKADEILFIDDNKENVKMAMNEGIKTIHYKNYKQLKYELSARGVR